MQPAVIPVSSDKLIGEVARIKVGGFRFVTMSCIVLEGDGVHVHYHFDRDLRLKHLRLATVTRNAIPSISSVYFAAFLVENEIQERNSPRTQEGVWLYQLDGDPEASQDQREPGIGRCHCGQETDRQGH